MGLYIRKDQDGFFEYLVNFLRFLIRLDLGSSYLYVIFFLKEWKEKMMYNQDFLNSFLNCFFKLLDYLSQINN